MDELNDMTLETFKLWSIHALRVYLSRRKRSVNGNFDELSARAFCAWEENLPVDENSEQVEVRLLQEYKSKLVVGGDILPDPFALDSGWIGEKTGMSSWPSIYAMDIAAYLNGSSPKEIVHRLMNEYKEGKAYRYFDCEWVKEVFLHTIRPNSDKCVLKAKVTPSQSINNKCYDVWIIVRKDNPSNPGGEVLSAYCTCTAGMFGTCNHIAGVLFRVEHAVKTGLTKTATVSTSQLCQWNIPKSKPSMKPSKVRDLTWRKGHYTKNPTARTTDKENLILKNEFTPLSKQQKDEVKDETTMREKLYTLLKPDISNSCFALLHEKRRIQAPKINIPDSLPTCAATVKDNIESNDKKSAFLERIKLSEQQQTDLKTATTDQSVCEMWREQRKGRVTASNFHRVCSRVNTLQKKPDADPTSLVAAIMGTTQSRPTTAMKHGISLEPHAKNVYRTEMCRKHRKFKVVESGLSVSLVEPYIGASADLEVECSCCGNGLCEIKCPETIKDQRPSEENLKYIGRNSKGLYLETSHQYYYQVQGQMGVLGKSYCDLFIYTFHGHLQMRIDFDSSFWEVIRAKIVWFWNKFVLDELLKEAPEIVGTLPIMASSAVPIMSTMTALTTSATAPTMTTTTVPPMSTVPTMTSTTVPPMSTVPTMTSSTVPPMTTTPSARRALQPIIANSTNKQRRKKTSKQPIYLCGTCGLDCVDEPQSEQEQSVECDMCGVWIHYICAGLTDEKVLTVKDWTCAKCSK